MLELFCGIGGCAAALPAGATVVGAVDLHRRALDVYRHNFPRHPTFAAAVESLPPSRLAELGADLWWMSPPCQPFTRRGLRRDLDDPRATVFHALAARLGEVRPPHVVLENVPGFADSRARRLLVSALGSAGYEVAEQLVCPSELGLPNRRRRYYLLASRRGRPAPSSPPPAPSAPLARLLDTAADRRALAVDPAILESYDGALDVVDADDPAARTACFTSAYGRSPVRSGSYLREDDGRIRRFSPTEILRLLGFPEGYTLPAELPLGVAFRLLGSSLSVPVVRHVLRALPGLSETGPDVRPRRRGLDSLSPAVNVSCVHRAPAVS